MTNTERIQAHNNELRECIELAETLPDAGGGGLPEQEKTISITTNGSHEILPDDGFTLSKVKVNVNVPIPEGYIKPNGTLWIRENGSYDVTDCETVNVEVSSGEVIVDNLPALLGGSLLEINNGANKVMPYCCRGQTNLTAVNLPVATNIGTYAFYGCTKLTTLNTPSVITLGTYAFYGCSNLAEVNFPMAATVPSTCFYQCTSLAKADFGMAKSIASNAFAYCSKLKTLILRYTSAVVTIATNSFSGFTFNGYVYVPKALLESYEADSTWSENTSAKFRAIEDYPDVCG